MKRRIMNAFPSVVRAFAAPVKRALALAVLVAVVTGCGL